MAPGLSRLRCLLISALGTWWGLSGGSGCGVVVVMHCLGHNRSVYREAMGMVVESAQRPRWRRYWDRHSSTYDREMRFFDRVLFCDTRSWICQQASGEVLEVAIGTGLNLEHYPPDVHVTGVELSHNMLAMAQRRAHDLGCQADLRVGDAEALDMASASFDTVVCTFSLCAIPDYRKALAEMTRVLRPGGLLLLADHVAAPGRALRAAQWILELVTVPLGGEHFLCRPLEHVRAAGFLVEGHDRFAAGIVERLAARKPTAYGAAG